MAHQASFSEKELMNDLLMSEKQLSGAYNTYVAEASTPELVNKLQQGLQNSQQCHRKVFDAMRQKGWYNPKSASPQDIQSAKQKYQQVSQQLT